MQKNNYFIFLVIIVIMVIYSCANEKPNKEKKKKISNNLDELADNMFNDIKDACLRSCVKIVVDPNKDRDRRYWDNKEIIDGDYDEEDRLKAGLVVILKVKGNMNGVYAKNILHSLYKRYEKIKDKEKMEKLVRITMRKIRSDFRKGVEKSDFFHTEEYSIIVFLGAELIYLERIEILDFLLKERMLRKIIEKAGEKGKLGKKNYTSGMDRIFYKLKEWNEKITEKDLYDVKKWEEWWAKERHKYIKK